MRQIFVLIPLTGLNSTSTPCHLQNEVVIKLHFILLGLLSGPYSQRFHCLLESFKTSFFKKACTAGNVLPSTTWTGRFGAPILTSLLQRYNTSVSTNIGILILFLFLNISGSISLEPLFIKSSKIMYPYTEVAKFSNHFVRWVKVHIIHLTDVFGTV